MAGGVTPEHEPQRLKSADPILFGDSGGRRRGRFLDPVREADLLPRSWRQQFPGSRDHRQDDQEQEAPQDRPAQSPAVAQ